MAAAIPAPGGGARLTTENAGSVPEPLAAGSFRSALTALLPLLLALLLWAGSIPAINPTLITDLGLVSVLPPAFFLALAVLIGGFCLALARGGGVGWLPAAYVAAWIVIIHGTPGLVYGSLRYAWAWKHVGIVDYILRNQRIDPAIASLPAYHNWPGFFGLGSLFTAAGGLSDALPLAIWAPVFFELFFAAGVLLILRAACPDPRLAWFGVWFFTLTNWVGQDYFAPQALAFACYLVVIGICLWAFPLPVSLAATRLGRWLSRWRPLVWMLAQLDRRIARAQQAGNSLPAVSAEQRRGLLAVVILLLLTIVVSHQLTPVVTILGLAALVVFGVCGARGLPVIAALFTAAWLVTGGGGYAAIGIREIVNSFGRAGQNVNANLIDASQFSPGVQLISNVARGLTAAVGLLALLGWLRRFRQGYLDLALTLLWLAPVGLLAISYGGEILFRVYFFALPFMAFYVAALFAPRRATQTVKAMALAALASVLLATGFLFAYYGHEKSNYFRPGEIAASDYLAEVAPAGSLIVEASPNYPSRYRRYEDFVYIPLIAWPRGNVEESINAYNLEDIVRMMSGPAYPETYLIITRGQLLELSRPGLASIESIQKEIDSSGAFEVVFQNDDAIVYRFTGPVPEEFR